MDIDNEIIVERFDDGKINGLYDWEEEHGLSIAVKAGKCLCYVGRCIFMSGGPPVNLMDYYMEGIMSEIDALCIFLVVALPT